MEGQGRAVVLENRVQYKMMKMTVEGLEAKKGESERGRRGERETLELCQIKTLRGYPPGWLEDEHAVCMSHLHSIYT